MRLRTWVRREGRGAIQRLSTATGLAYSTVFAAIFHMNKRPNYETAKKISAATNGLVSVEDILERRV